jgi:hypothetical protein
MRHLLAASNDQCRRDYALTDTAPGQSESRESSAAILRRLQVNPAELKIQARVCNSHRSEASGGISPRDEPSKERGSHEIT